MIFIITKIFLREFISDEKGNKNKEIKIRNKKLIKKIKIKKVKLFRNDLKRENQISKVRKRIKK